MNRRIHPHHHDPYTPPPPRQPPAAPSLAAALPVRRFRRLGGSQRVVEMMGEWWEGLTEQAREEHVERWGVQADGDLDLDLAGIDKLFRSAAPTAMTSWVRRQPDRRAAARLASLIEQRRTGGSRPALVQKLTEMGAPE
jgi:hypothetical protein